MSSEMWLLSLIGITWATVALQCALAVRSLIVERREGLHAAPLRAVVATVSLAVATGAVVISLIPASQFDAAHGQPAAPPSAPSRTTGPAPAALTPEAQRRVATLTAELQTLTREATERQQRIGVIQAELRRLQAQQARPSLFGNMASGLSNITNGNRQTRLVIVLAAETALLVIGFAVLVLGGSMQTLLPEGWRYNRTAADIRAARARDVDDLAAMVWREEYRPALEKARAIPDKILEGFDRLDFLFLRGYCGVQVASFPAADDTSEYRSQVIADAIENLERVVDEAPKRGDAVYTLALAYGLASKDVESLAKFEAARSMLQGQHLPFDHNESVCLLRLGESSLSTGDTGTAEERFARVGVLGTLASAVAQSRLRISMIGVRGALNRQDLTGALAALETIATISDLSPDQRAQIAVVRSALDARMALRQDDPESALNHAEGVLAKQLPPELPVPDDDVADETFSLVQDADLHFPREVLREFLFIRAVALCRMEAKKSSGLSEAQVTRLSEPLLRALQLVPRHRHVLGALGGLYYWFSPDRRDRAREWLEAAAAMGVSGRIVRTILEQDRMLALERRGAMDWFRTASGRFLRDPTLSQEVRRMLLEELGRFQECEPVLLSLQERPELEDEEPTIEILRDRARYLSQVIAHVTRTGVSDRFATLAKMHTDYTASLAALEQSTTTLGAIERQIMAEFGRALTL